MPRQVCVKSTFCALLDNILSVMHTYWSSISALLFLALGEPESSTDDRFLLPITAGNWRKSISFVGLAILGSASITRAATVSETYIKSKSKTIINCFQTKRLFEDQVFQNRVNKFFYTIIVLVNYTFILRISDNRFVIEFKFNIVEQLSNYSSIKLPI